MSVFYLASFWSANVSEHNAGDRRSDGHRHALLRCTNAVRNRKDPVNIMAAEFDLEFTRDSVESDSPAQVVTEQEAIAPTEYEDIILNQDNYGTGPWPHAVEFPIRTIGDA